MTRETPFEEGMVQNLEDMENNGVEPYDSADVEPTAISDFISQYEHIESIEDDTDWVLSGRIRRQNEFGEFGFYDIDDRTGTVQVMCSVDDRLEFRTSKYDTLDDVNVGDRIVFIGSPGRSDTGELTLFAEDFVVTSKNLRDITDEWNVLGDRQEIENRTGALTQADDSLFRSVRQRMEIQQSIRQYLTSRDYLEVETPILHNYAGGAEATPFGTYCEALDREVYLRIAPELFLKRLMVAGYGRVFEIGKCFRNEDIDTTHNPEFSMLELYEEYSDYQDMMNLTESMIESIATEVTGGTTLSYGDVNVDFTTPWNRRSFDDCVSEAIGTEIDDLDRDELVSFLSRNHDFEQHQLTDYAYDELLIEVFEHSVEPSIEQPTFIYDYPTISTPLCQTTDENEDRVERFEAFACGMEIANSYTELTDPREQRDRLIQQADGDESAVNNEFVNALAYGMPPTAGLGIGIERIAMLLTDSQSIKDVLPFPMASSRT